MHHCFVVLKRFIVGILQQATEMRMAEHTFAMNDKGSLLFSMEAVAYSIFAPQITL